MGGITRIGHDLTISGAFEASLLVSEGTLCWRYQTKDYFPAREIFSM